MKRMGGDDEKLLNRETLETVLSNTLSGIAVVTPHPDGVRLEYTNNAFFRLFGYTRDEYENVGYEVRMNLFNLEDFMDIIAKINGDYAQGEELSFQCRIKKKGGDVGWVIINAKKLPDGIYVNNSFCCSITEITEQKKLEEKLQQEKERYEMIEEVSDNIIFNYDVETDVFEASAKILRGLGTKTRINNAIESFTYGNLIDHRDVPAFIGALSNALSGKRINVFDARVINSRGDSLWYRIKFAVVNNAEGSPVRMVGMLIDIDKEKKEKSRLVAQAETDQLTGFLNKLSTSLKISEMIKERPDSTCAMFLIDIDDFKKLNDTYGHREGDSFLKNFTAKISSSFRSTDVLGRVGGEEFVIYASGIADVERYVAEKAEQIENICHSIRIESAPEKQFSCSIGIALFPKDGDSYNQLYERADKAMYWVKRHGKNSYEFYGNIEE